MVLIISTKFEAFIKRMGRVAEFLPFQNRLLNAMRDDAKAKYIRYPELINEMKKIWVEGTYKKEKAIANLLVDHEEFVMKYLKNLFPFRNAGLQISDVTAPSRLDYVLTVTYDYSPKEIKIIEEILKSNTWPSKPTVDQVCKFILLYCINSFAFPIQEVFEGPFAFFIESIKVDKNPDGGLTVAIHVHAREQ